MNDSRAFYYEHERIHQEGRGVEGQDAHFVFQMRRTYMRAMVGGLVGSEDSQISKHGSARGCESIYSAGVLCPIGGVHLPIAGASSVLLRRAFNHVCVCVGL